jgi:hypothetical protein
MESNMEKEFIERMERIEKGFGRMESASDGWMMREMLMMAITDLLIMVANIESLLNFDWH